MTNPTNDIKNAPRHVAIIMDGNGRWARARGLERSAGHIEGVNAVRRITRAAQALGVEYLTLYTFSTENWNRPAAEVEMLMHLVVSAIENETPELIAKGVRLGMIGDIDRLPDDARHRLEKCIADTANGQGLQLILAISYSSRWEITNAVRNIARQVASGTLNPDDITDFTVADNLETAGLPDPDLLIRTGGDMRISNFLLWQLAYTEIVVTQKYWPDFDRTDLEQAFDVFNRRERRFGLTGDQIANLNKKNDGSPS